MKKLLPAIAAALLLSACSNEFEVTAPWKDIPVVYGIISPNDTAHYVRIEKAFLDPGTSALDLARIPDSLYYDDATINVFLERVSTGQRKKMTRVDGNAEGHVRADGLFANQPNWLYKFKPTPGSPFLVGNEAVKIVIERGDNLPVVTGQTNLPGDFRFQSPSTFQPEIQFVTGNNPRIDWRTDEFGVLFDVSLDVRYRETTSQGVFVKRDTLRWNALPNIRRTNNTTQPGVFRGEAILSTDAFYNFLLANIPVQGDRLRYFEGCNIILTGGGSEIEALQQTISANSGIVGAEAFPLYTNMSEGFGIFTGRNTSTLFNVLIKPETVKSMNDNPDTQKLNFRS